MRERPDRHTEHAAPVARLGGVKHRIRRGLLAFAVVVGACGDLSEGSRALDGGPSPAPSVAAPAVTPVATMPNGLVSPADVERRALGLTAIIRRVDRVSTRLMDTGQLRTDFSAAIPQAWAPGRLFWVVALVGEFSSDSIVDTGLSPCKLIVFDAHTGDAEAAGGGPLKSCAPYFSVDLTPPAAPVSCGPEPWGYSYPGASPTRPGPVPLTIARDDAWQMPTVVSGSFRYEGGNEYETFCRAENIVTVPGGDQYTARILRGLGSPQVVGPVPQDMAQLWLKNYHALGATAGSDVVRVVIEPRPGFEIASFDWHAVAPRGGYVNFRFVDRSGQEIIPFRVANGP